MEAAIEEKAGAARAMRCWGVDFNTLPRGERERERGTSCGGCDLYEMLQPL